MPRDRDHNPSKTSSKTGQYVYAAAITEDAGNDPSPTYAVQFAWKPCKQHLQGGGAMWKKKEAQAAADSSDSDSVIICDDIPQQNGVAKPNGSHDVSEIQPEGSSKYAQDDSPWRNLFATCNGNYVRVYQAESKTKPRLLHVYEDLDPEEQFYCVAWTYNVTGAHEWWVCAAGKKGVLRVINIQKGKLENSLIGHGEAINDMKVHPRDPALVITASKDESLRLWNLRVGITIAVFAGLKGHRGEVVHTDFNRDGSRFASCGIDNSVRIWDFYENENVVAAVKQSHEIADLGFKGTHVYADKTGSRKKFKVPIAQFPFFVTRKVHKHYVDCVMWVGDLLLSKSVHNRMFLWEPEQDRESLASPATEYTLLEEYVLEVCNVWFIRFALSRNRRLVACGNDKGVVSVFDLTVLPSRPLCTVQPKDRHRYSAQFVRQCSFSEDGSMLVAVDDASSVVQYERVGP